MLFKHPELLYALLLLLIPILVHLFRLRKFRKEKFTNVKLLKKASLQTRKSSRIKKWLILCTRLLLFTSIIIAFAQPFWPSLLEEIVARETVIYLDNSYSMQAKGEKGILLKQSIQELLENLPEEQEFTLFTNNTEFKNATLKSVMKELQQLSYSPNQLEWKTLKLKAGNYFSKHSNTHKNFIAISDFQNFKTENIDKINGIETQIVQLKPENLNNIAIDTVYISSKTLNETELAVTLKASGNPDATVPISLYNGETLLAKKSVALEENNLVTTIFELPSQPVLNGKITIEDVGLSFDNNLFFSINESDPIAIAVINNAESTFLERIFTEPDFKLQVFPENQVNYTQLVVAKLIILNELDEISLSLSGILQELLKENVHLIIIPSENANLESYNAFFQNNDLPTFQEKIAEEKLITGISFEHPLYQSVFNEEVENFEYPKVQSFFSINGKEAPLLGFENQISFLFQQENVFVFTAALNTENSNFQASPLIVPTLYNIGNSALQTAQPYYLLGKTNEIDIQVELNQDEILKMRKGNQIFIPRQQVFQNKVKFILENNPDEVGYYTVLKDSTNLKILSFNINRNESRLETTKIQPSEGIEIKNSIPAVFQELQTQNQKPALWKWFVIFALSFLLTEMLILKYFK